ncbi:MAG: DNA adenine methylase, partial [Prosthecobacter sp.]|nr:DNA adenine methylase [Prosthecobacter sp.]
MSGHTSFLTVDAALFPELTAQGAGAPTHGVQYIGNKRKLLDWIREQIPEGVKTVVDAFAGGGSVSYMLKREGYQVHSNDSLHWPHHIARAVVVNQTETVTDEEIEALCQPNPKAGTFVRDNYKDKFWKPEIHGVIDEVRENVDALKGFKRDIALAALGATMLSARGWFPQFTTSKVSEDGYSPEQFHKRLGEVIRRLNSMVQEGPTCTAQRLEVREFLPKVKADLAYFDPPYVTEFSAANYSANYHVVEAVMVKGEGRNPKADSVTKMEKTQADLTKANILEFFQEVFAAADHIPDWLLSYRDHSYPSEAEMQELFEKAG